MVAQPAWELVALYLAGTVINSPRLMVSIVQNKPTQRVLSSIAEFESQPLDYLKHNHTESKQMDWEKLSLGKYQLEVSISQDTLFI